MSETTHRILRLLGLLESRTSWLGSELAERLGVTERTVRRDVSRLRELGYPVEAERGLAGGYRLGAGRRLPPLLVDDDEAVALVACLRMGALSGADALGEAALRALGKLEQVLPARLRVVVDAVNEATDVLPRQRPAIDWAQLSQLAAAQRSRSVVRFRYTRADGTDGTDGQGAAGPGTPADEREVEPARLAVQGERWYLQAFDRGRDDWRTFRLDRIRDVRVTTWTFAHRTPPALDLGWERMRHWPCVAEVVLTASPDVVIARIPPAYRDDVREVAEGCRLTVGGGTWDEIALHLLWAARDLEARLLPASGHRGEPLRRALAELAEQASAAARAVPPG